MRRLALILAITGFYAAPVQAQSNSSPSGTTSVHPDVVVGDAERAIRNFAAAVASYTKACDNGDADGCSNLGRSYSLGEGVEKDLNRTFALYQLACEGGSLKGCSNLGYAYDNGVGTAEDAARAAELYQRACDGGHGTGCTNLAGLYADGRGVTKDLPRAARLFNLGCNRGHELACTRLETMNVEGNGVIKDRAPVPKRRDWLDVELLAPVLPVPRVILELEVLVLADGRVGSCKIIRPGARVELEQKVCRQAVGRLRFKPALRDSVPVEATFRQCLTLYRVDSKGQEGRCDVPTTVIQTGVFDN